MCADSSDTHASVTPHSIVYLTAGVIRAPSTSACGIRPAGVVCFAPVQALPASEHSITEAATAAYVSLVAIEMPGPTTTERTGMAIPAQEIRAVLQDWLSFLRSESHLLTRWPSLLFQEAANQPEGSSPARIALRWDRLSPRPWLRWENKPERIGDCVLTLVGHSSWVDCCAFSPDGSLVVSASGSNGRTKTLMICEVSTGREITTIESTFGYIVACAFSRDGRRITAATRYGFICVWEIPSGREIARTRYSEQWIRSFSFGDDRERPLEAMLLGDLHTLLVKRGEETFTILSEGAGDRNSGGGDQGYASACAISQDGQLAALGWENGTIEVWDLDNRMKRFSIAGGALRRLGGGLPPVEIRSIAFSPDGGRVVAHSSWQWTKTWDTTNGNVLITLPESTRATDLCMFSPDGTMILTAGPELRLWDAATGEERYRFVGGHTRNISCCAFSQDGKWIVTGSVDHTLKIWTRPDSQRERETSSSLGVVKSCSISMDGTLVLLAGELDGRALLLNVPDGSEVLAVGTHQDAADIICGLSPDASKILTASSGNALEVWDRAVASPIATMEGHEKTISFCAFTPDGTRVFSASEDDTLRLWDAQDGREVIRFPQVGIVYKVAMSPDGARVAVVSGAEYGSDSNPVCTAYMWDLVEGRLLAAVEGADDFTRPEFSLDGQRLVALWNDGSIRVIDALTGAHIVSSPGGDPFAVSPDGRRIATRSGKDLVILDSSSGAVTARLLPPTSTPSRCAFSPGGLRLAATSQGGQMLEIWDLVNLEQKHLYSLGYCGGDFDWAPPGHRLVVGTIDGPVDGPVHILSLQGFRIETPVVTGVFLYLHERRRWDDKSTFVCKWCGRRCPLSASVSEVLRSIAGNVGHLGESARCEELPPEAWDERGLLSECPHCHRPLKFNPVVVDNRDRH